jgi:hypothetical protein
MYYRRDSLSRKLKLGLINADDGGDGDRGGGDGGEKWYSSMPESVQEWDEVKNSDSPDKFWDQMSNQRSRLGRSITIPGDDAGDEQWAEFNTKVMNKVPTLMQKPDFDNKEAMDNIYGSLGRPEKAEGYTMPEIKDAQDKAVDMTQAKDFQNIAHKHGLNQSQYEGIVQEVTGLNMAAQDVARQNHVESHTKLKAEWGADYNRRMSVAVNIATLTDAPESVVKILSDGAGSTEEYKWLYSLAQRFKGEGKNLMKDANDDEVKFTPEQVDTQINEIRNNKKHPYWDKTAPGHKSALTKMKELYEMKEKTAG